jgi:acetyltransferase-like isoleucine patch superfamily enzyme
MPWNRLSLRLALLRRDVYVRRPLHGNSARMIREGRLEIGRGCVIEADVTIRSVHGRVRLGRETYLSRGVTLGALDRVEIGDHTLVGPGCYITDSNHQFRDPITPMPHQGMVTKGPTVIEDNVWLGANVVVTSGVRIGRRSIVGANTVVTHDLAPYSVATGASAKVSSWLALSDEMHAGPLSLVCPASARRSGLSGFGRGEGQT